MFSDTKLTNKTLTKRGLAENITMSVCGSRAEAERFRIQEQGRALQQALRDRITNEPPLRCSYCGRRKTADEECKGCGAWVT